MNFFNVRALFPITTDEITEYRKYRRTFNIDIATIEVSEQFIYTTYVRTRSTEGNDYITKSNIFSTCQVSIDETLNILKSVMVETLKLQDVCLGSSASDCSSPNAGVLLEETFYILSKKNTVFKVRLTEKGLSLRKESNGSTKEQTILLRDIIGCRCMRSKRRPTGASSCVCSSLTGPNSLRVVEENSGEQDENDVSAYLYIYAYILKQNRRGGRRERSTITLRFRSFDKYEDNNKEAQRWRAAIKCLIRDLPVSLTYSPSDTRKLLVLLNPKSGPGKARQLFQQRVAPVLAEAEIPFDLHVTKRANFAREFVRLRDIFSWRGIVVVGGDGICFEVLNGLFERQDWKRAANETTLGIIPCGSGNGLAKTICHLYDEPYDPKPVLGAALAVVRGRSSAMDLVRVETRSQIMFSFLSVGWGFLSDIDIESERLRLLGGQRFTLWSLARLIGLRTYRGTVSYLPAIGAPPAPKKPLSLTHSASRQDPMMECKECRGQGDCDNCDAGFGDVINLETGGGVIPQRQRLDSWYSATSRRSAYYSTVGSCYESVFDSTSQNSDKGPPGLAVMYGPASQIPALTAAVPANWTMLDGEFLLVHAAYQTHIGTDAFIAPSSKLDDGIIWMIIVRGGTTRGQLLAFLLGLNSGTHMDGGPKDNVLMVPVTAFRIEPQGGPGNMTVDGESVEYGPIQGEIFPSLARIMVP